MGEEKPKVFVPQTNRANVFLEYFTHKRGRNLGKVLDTALPVYEQSRFERLLYRWNVTVTGDGVAQAQFDFDPAPPFPTFRVNWIQLRNEDTANRTWKVLRALLGAVGTDDVVIGTMALKSGDNAALVSPNGSPQLNSVNLFSNTVASPFTCERNHLANEAAGVRESFKVLSNTLTTLGDTITCVGEIEVMPDAAAIRDGNQLMVATP